MMRYFFLLALLCATLCMHCKKKDTAPANCSIQENIGLFTVIDKFNFNEGDITSFVRDDGFGTSVNVNQTQLLDFFDLEIENSRVQKSNCVDLERPEQFVWEVNEVNTLYSGNLPDSDAGFQLLLTQTVIVDDVLEEPKEVGTFLEARTVDPFSGVMQTDPFLRIPLEGINTERVDDFIFGFTFESNTLINGQAFNNVWVSNTALPDGLAKIYLSTDLGLIGYENNAGNIWRLQN